MQGFDTFDSANDSNPQDLESMHVEGFDFINTPVEECPYQNQLSQIKQSFCKQPINQRLRSRLNLSCDF